MSAVRDWIPVPASPKGRLVIAAVEAFGARPFDDVTVGDLSRAAQVTTGALYHHFGSKLGLYAVVRDDVERRLLDRMEGAIASASAGEDGDRGAAVRTALLVGFDFAVREGFLQLLGAWPAAGRPDRLAELLSMSTAPAPAELGPIVAAAWRAAVLAVAAGAPADSARAALGAVEIRIPAR